MSGLPVVTVTIDAPRGVVTITIPPDVERDAYIGAEGEVIRLFDVTLAPADVTRRLAELEVALEQVGADAAEQHNDHRVHEPTECALCALLPEDPR